MKPNSVCNHTHDYQNRTTVIVLIKAKTEIYLPLCLTGISRQDYWRAVREEEDLEWRCRSCFIYDPPQFESTKDEEMIIEEMAEEISDYNGE